MSDCYENRLRQTCCRGNPCGCPFPAPPNFHPLMWPSQGHGHSGVGRNPERPVSREYSLTTPNWYFIPCSRPIIGGHVSAEQDATACGSCINLVGVLLPDIEGGQGGANANSTPQTKLIHVQACVRTLKRYRQFTIVGLTSHEQPQPHTLSHHHRRRPRRASRSSDREASAVPI